MEGRQAKTDHNSQSKGRKITQEAKENSKNKNMQTSWSVGKCYLDRAWWYFAAPDCFGGGVSIRYERQREAKKNY